MNSRRDFLQKITAATIAFPFLKQAVAANKSLSQKPYDGPVLRVAIMGLGSYGTRVAEAMRDCTMAKLVGVISGTPSKLQHGKASIISLKKIAITMKISIMLKTTRILMQCM